MNCSSFINTSTVQAHEQFVSVNVKNSNTGNDSTRKRKKVSNFKVNSSAKRKKSVSSLSQVSHSSPTTTNIVSKKCSRLVFGALLSKGMITKSWDDELIWLYDK